MPEAGGAPAPRAEAAGHCARRRWTLRYADPAVEARFLRFQHRVPHRRNAGALFVAALLFTATLWVYSFLTPLEVAVRLAVSGLCLLAAAAVGVPPVTRRLGVTPRGVEGLVVGCGVWFVAVVAAEHYLLETHLGLLYSGRDRDTYQRFIVASLSPGAILTVLVAYMATTVRAAIVAPALTAGTVVPFLATRWATGARDPPALFVCRLLALGLGNAVGAIARASEERMHRTVFEQADELERQEAAVRRAMRCVDQLVSEMLPPRVIELLRLGLPVTDTFPLATVVYTDVVEFTKWAGQHPPRVVVQLLNDMFCAFDALAQYVNEADVLQAEAGDTRPASPTLEKIKTIGDAYWAVSGLQASASGREGALLAVHFAQAVQGWAQAYAGAAALRLRVGVHSGPVLAGIVGRLKPSYDVFGLTDAVAQRVENAGQPGEVSVSDVTRRLVDGHFRCVPRATAAHVGAGAVAVFAARRCRCVDAASPESVAAVPGGSSPAAPARRYSSESDRPEPSPAQSQAVPGGALPHRWQHLACIAPLSGASSPEPPCPEPSCDQECEVPAKRKERPGCCAERDGYARYREGATRGTHAALVAIVVCHVTVLAAIYGLVAPPLLLAPRGAALLLALLLMGGGVWWLRTRRTLPLLLIPPVAGLLVLTVPFGGAKRNALVVAADLPLFLQELCQLEVVLWVATFFCFHHRHPAVQLALAAGVGAAGVVGVVFTAQRYSTYALAFIVQLLLSVPYSWLAHQAMRQQFQNYLHLQREEANAEAEAAVYERLLHSLFPASVVPRLLAGQRPAVPEDGDEGAAAENGEDDDEDDGAGPLVADPLPQVGVLFCSIDGLDAPFLLQRPQETFHLLNRVFSALDAFVLERPALEKIKVIGKTYMVVSGIPQQADAAAGDAPVSPLSARRAAPSARPAARYGPDAPDLLGLLDLAQRFHQLVEAAAQDLAELAPAASGSPPAAHLSGRAGVHVGPAVGAVIGRRLKLSYDVFGDVVNVASRICHSPAASGATCVSGAVVDCLASGSAPPAAAGWGFAGPTTIAAKGKGLLAVHLAQPRAAASPNGPKGDPPLPAGPAAGFCGPDASAPPAVASAWR